MRFAQRRRAPCVRHTAPLDRASLPRSRDPRPGLKLHNGMFDSSRVAEGGRARLVHFCFAACRSQGDDPGCAVLRDSRARCSDGFHLDTSPVGYLDRPVT